MAKSVKTIRKNYRGHNYEVALTYTQVTGSDMPGGGDKFITDAVTTVDGKLITVRTPGFEPSDEDTEPAILQAVTAYIDYLENK